MGKLMVAITRAVWAEDKDIAEDAVVRACLEEAGFDPSLADSGLLAGAETYAANLEEAVERVVSTYTWLRFRVLIALPDPVELAK